MSLKITIEENDFSMDEYSKLLSVLKKALKISKCDRKIIIKCIETKEKDTYAFTDWPTKYFFSVPIVKLTKKLMQQDRDTIGFTLTHEFIHCRQGFWTILIQNILYLFKSGFPPFEIEAYDSINDWYAKDSENAK